VQLNLDLNKLIDDAMVMGVPFHIRVQLFYEKKRWVLSADLLVDAMNWQECRVEIKSGENHAETLGLLMERINERLGKKTEGLDEEAEAPA
jgi:hypothetical protein